MRTNHIATSWRSLLLMASAVSFACPADAGEWIDDLIRLREAATPTQNLKRTPLPDFGTGTYTVSVWVKATSDGAIWAKANAKGKWIPNGKALFIRRGKVAFDIGWVGVTEGKTRLTDNAWHHVAFVGGYPQQIYVNGKLEASGSLAKRPDPNGTVFKIGQVSDNFGGSRLPGAIDELRIFGKRLSEADIELLAAGRVPDTPCLSHWHFDATSADAVGGNDATIEGKVRYVPGKVGKAMDASAGYGTVPAAVDPVQALWTELRQTYKDDPAALVQMGAARDDGIWRADWQTAPFADIATRYASAVGLPAGVAARINAQAVATKTAADLKGVHGLYLQALRHERLLTAVKAAQLDTIRAAIAALYQGRPVGKQLAERLNKLGDQAAKWKDVLPAEAVLSQWQEAVAILRSDVVLKHNPVVDFDKLVFVRRKTYTANHYYTKHINSRWLPGGNICVLDLRTSQVHELVPELADGVFERFDLAFDASKIVFAWKGDKDQGYRIYEIDINPVTGRRTGSKLRQLTFPPRNEADLQRDYRVRYHHGTDDMQPCYLPDGGIAFVSTRCQYGILCDAPDDFTTSVVYRMAANGGNMKRLTNSSVSENAPVALPDGRVLYTRWEYFDKGAVSVKCLWAMNPDGSSSSEIYGADIAFPPTMIHGRPIPDSPSEFVVLGAPHCPQNNMGTVIRLDVSRDIRTRAPMTYMTPYVDIKREGGFHFRQTDGSWRADSRGRGPLFADPYPLSRNLFLVSHKPAGELWTHPTAYGLFLLDETGQTHPIHSDGNYSCWEPFPLMARPKPPVMASAVSPAMARRDLATCVVTDVYHGMEGVARGSIKFIRVLEQIPRPWAARRRWSGDVYDQQHATITKDTHLGLKVQHGIVPVEEDGSAHFIVPAMANISLQVLDENYLAVQTERTYVNYIPGESRSCIGCHETPNDAPVNAAQGTPNALTRTPSVPGPQPGEKSGQRPLDFAADVQPVLDRHCIGCHAGNEPKAGLDLSGTETQLFSRAYESLVRERRRGKGRPRTKVELLPTVGENHPKTGNVHYMPARSFGSHNSILVAMLAPHAVELKAPERAAVAAKLARVHGKVTLAREELLKITNWVDTNAQFYGMYWGRKNLRHKGHPHFRPVPTFAQATSYETPFPETPAPAPTRDATGGIK